MGNMRYEVGNRVAGEKGDYFVSIIVNGSVWVNLSVSRTLKKLGCYQETVISGRIGTTLFVK